MNFLGEIKNHQSVPRSRPMFAVQKSLLSTTRFASVQQSNERLFSRRRFTPVEKGNMNIEEMDIILDKNSTYKSYSKQQTYNLKKDCLNSGIKYNHKLLRK